MTPALPASERACHPHIRDDARATPDLETIAAGDKTFFNSSVSVTGTSKMGKIKQQHGNSC